MEAPSLGVGALAAGWVGTISCALSPTLLGPRAFSPLDKTREVCSTGPGQAVHKRAAPNGQ